MIVTTAESRIMGEEWLNEHGEVVSTVSQPHVWEQVLSYLATIEAWPPADTRGLDHRTCAGSIGALRGDVSPSPDAGPASDDDTAEPIAATGGGAAPLALLTLGAFVAFGRRRSGR